MTIFQIFQEYGGAFRNGLTVTLQLALIVWSTGLILGALLGAASARWPKCVGWPARAISICLAAMPALVFLFWMHYPLQSILGIVVDPLITASVTLSIINIFLVADHCRGAINDFPTQYLWAAQVCGLSDLDTNLKIKLPILLRQIIPGLLMIQITMLQATLFASLISVDEIFRAAQRVNSLIYRPVEIYTMLAGAFIMVCVPLHLFANYLRTRFTRDTSDR